MMSTPLPPIPSFLFCSFPLVFFYPIIMLIITSLHVFILSLLPKCKDFVFSLMSLLDGVQCLLHNRGSINMYELNKED